MKKTLAAVSLVSAAAIALAGCSPSNENDSTAQGTQDNATATAAQQSEKSNEAVNLTVLAAASTRVLNDDLDELTKNLDQPLNLEYINGGSSGLVQQLQEGHPGDVFISADKKNMDKAVDTNVAANPVEIARNSMVMVVPKGNPGKITGVDDGSMDGKNVVLCDEQVPCGNVSKAIQEDLGKKIEAVSLEQSVSDVLGKVTSGEADAGWVYRTDAQAAGDAVEVIEIPKAEDHVNSLYAALTANSENPEAAQELIDLLTSADFAKVWERYGFTPVAK
ncbi:hypothetical protein CATYP_06585 [Corynebacterium atypicum]|uniref:Molybdate-binding protein n=1 Tax=Corynebacterium atypicum TaxID=191610 RepID=A0ABN4DFY9_9CORY|nr:molybdate ABC transporter substrate-binding protein [Corynebacterium atypicum]AIG64327.1 hypothetical protein CATYP_06585 [Corynebacterium atypicum]